MFGAKRAREYWAQTTASALAATDFIINRAKSGDFETHHTNSVETQWVPTQAF